MWPNVRKHRAALGLSNLAADELGHVIDFLPKLKKLLRVAITMQQTQPPIISIHVTTHLPVGDAIKLQREGWISLNTVEAKKIQQMLPGEYSDEGHAKIQYKSEQEVDDTIMHVKQKCIDYIADKTIINKSIRNHERHGRRVVYITIKYLSPDYNMISRLMALNKKSRAEWK